MPVLPSLPEAVIKQFFLPVPNTKEVDGQQVAMAQDDPDRGWVKLDVSPMNVQDRLSAEAGEKPMQASIRVLTQRIHEWNFTETDGTPVAITPVSVLRLGDENLNYLASKIPQESSQTLTTGQKKS